MLSHYTGSDQFLFSAFAQCTVQDTIAFFNDRGMKTKEEAEGRMFPVSDKAQSVLDVLTRYIKEGGVQVQTSAVVADIAVDVKTKHIRVRSDDATEIVGRACVVATGGVSRPETGSTGDGFVWLKTLGHTIADTSSSLVPVALKDAWAKKLSGVTLTDIKLTVFQNGKKQSMKKGKLLFTHFGVSGPTVFNMSKVIGELLEQGDVMLALDLFPRIEHDVLKKKLQVLLIGESNKKIKNTLDALVPSALVSPLLALAWIDGETANHSVKKEERAKLLLLLKAVPLHVRGLLGADKAIVSSGGAALTEVNFKTMESRVVKNIYIVGDALNIDRPSGGYSLQICWTTGFVAGSHC